MRQVYLDHIAGTPLDPLALEAMLPYLRDRFGNPQSLHSVGQEALGALEEARSRVAGLIGADDAEVYFTSGGSESNNFALKGMAMARRDKGNHLVLSAIEHQSILQAAKSLEKSGFCSTLVPVDNHGLVDPEDVKKAIRKETALVSVILASNEVGTIEPLGEIARICRAAGVPLHTDAVAAVGNMPVDVRELGVDALSLAADQFYGPKGSGALYLKKGIRILPLIDGGIQEGGRRAGTENVAGIVGMGRAAEIAGEKLAERPQRMRDLRDRLIDHASFCIEFIEGEAMLLNLDMKGIAVSSGSACTSRALKASHVLLAMGIDHALAQGSLVFSLIDGTTAEDIDYLVDVLPPVIDRLRKMSPLYTQFLEGKKK
jgi:cysteine desulfurase